MLTAIGFRPYSDIEYFKSLYSVKKKDSEFRMRPKVH